MAFPVAYAQINHAYECGQCGLTPEELLTADMKNFSRRPGWEGRQSLLLCFQEAAARLSGDLGKASQNPPSYTSQQNSWRLTAL